MSPVQEKQLVEACGIDAESILTWIGENLTPDEVFDEEVLNDWANEHDFEKRS